MLMTHRLLEMDNPVLSGGRFKWLTIHGGVAGKPVGHCHGLLAHQRLRQIIFQWAGLVIQRRMVNHLEKKL